MHRVPTILAGQPPQQGPLQTVPCGAPWERLRLDMTGSHHRSRQGHVYNLTVMDNISKYVEAIPLANQEAMTVAKARVETVILSMGPPFRYSLTRGETSMGMFFMRYVDYSILTRCALLVTNQRLMVSLRDFTEP